MTDNVEPTADDAAATDAATQSLGRIAALQSSAKLRAADATAWATKLRDRSLIVDAGFVVYERDRVAAGSVLGSAIAFRLFLFFVPTVLFGVGLLGLFSGSVDSEGINESASLTGALADQVRTALSQSPTAAWLTLLTGLILMVTSGRTLARALVASSSLAWLTGGKVTAKVRVVGIVIGLFLSLMLFSAVINKVRDSLGVAVASISFTLTLSFYFVLMVLLMAALPRRTPDPAALLPGAALTSLVIVGMQAISQLYLPSRFSDASELYGGIGVALVTLGWLFIVGRTLALSFSMNAALFDRFGSLSQVIFALPGLRTLPRRSKFVRRYFGVDAAGHSVTTEAMSTIGGADVVDADVLTAIETLTAVDDTP